MRVHKREVTSPNTTTTTTTSITDQDTSSFGLYVWDEKTLSERLFDELEQEIAIVMIDTHHRFKLSLEFQKQMKIHNIQNKLKQTKGGVSSSNNNNNPPSSNGVVQTSIINSL
ncbi:hypothetical protein FDP41_002996 [Naegleria fowleri]|uniref:Uncharacterized protein n=1 Tax=Naegleria fowleri TaxID=5763 RepID=A0A6A5BTV2_NAEFO|nr:uncharacterized protein FDP41_002996 [Naegleria fowleri]KAF0977674.1 hypothetical protein FDP41_002996 [Naegleria fowleri]